LATGGTHQGAFRDKLGGRGVLRIVPGGVGEHKEDIIIGGILVLNVAMKARMSKIAYERRKKLKLSLTEKIVRQNNQNVFQSFSPLKSIN